MEHHAGLVAVALGVGLQLFEKQRHVGRRRLLTGIAARKREIRLKHAAHLVDVEREILGMDHMELGGLYLRKMNFPPGLVEAAQFHASPEKATAEPAIIAAVQPQPVPTSLIWRVSVPSLRTVTRRFTFIVLWSVPKSKESPPTTVTFGWATAPWA